MPPLEATEHKSDLLIRDLWQNGTEIFHDMCVVTTYANYHLAQTLEKCRQEEERVKKKMYFEACIQQLQHFLPFLDSVDGMLGVEATATLKSIASCLASKWRQPYYRTCRYVKSRISTTLMRATHRCIRGFRVPSHKVSVQRPQWEDGTGINLFR